MGDGQGGADAHTMAGGLDIRTTARAVLAPLIAWCAAVAGVTLAGNPGVVCVTPMAWLMACWTGNFCAERSRSPSHRRLVEAALAGALLGLAQGIVFAIVSALRMPVAPGEERQALLLTLAIIVMGVVVSALLSLGTAAMRARRRGA